MTKLLINLTIQAFPKVFSGGLLLFAALMGFSASASDCPVANETASSRHISLARAKVEWVDLEGGYYRIIDSLNRRFLPQNLGQFPQLQKDGLVVCGLLEKIDQGYSFQMGGEVAVRVVSLAMATQTQ